MLHGNSDCVNVNLYVVPSVIYQLHFCKLCVYKCNCLW